MMIRRYECSISNRKKNKHVIQTSIYSRMLDYIPRTPNPSKNIKTLHSSLFTQKRRKENEQNIKVDTNFIKLNKNYSFNK